MPLLLAVLALLLGATFGGCKKNDTAKRSGCDAEPAARATIEGCAACCKKHGMTFRSWVDPKTAAVAGRGTDPSKLVICSCSPK